MWIPKDRHKVFSEPYRSELKAIIQEIGYDYDIDRVELEVPVDHIHMVMRSELKLSPLKVMQVIKSISAREFFKLRLEIRRKYFWGGKLRTQSYFAETISNANEDVIRAYVQNQINAMNDNEVHAHSLGCFETWSLAAEYFIKGIQGWRRRY